MAEKQIINTSKSIVMALMTMLFFSCKDSYERVGEEAKKAIFPRGIAQNLVLKYTEAKENMDSEATGSSKLIAVLTSPVREDYENLKFFPYQTFPEGLTVDFYDDKNEKSTISADYGIIYSATNLIDLQGNVVMESHDGKKLETSQLYYDRINEWIFTQEKFTYTNPQDGTIMDGEGMDISKDRTVLKAHKTYGLMLIKEEKKEDPKEESND